MRSMWTLLYCVLLAFPVVSILSAESKIDIEAAAGESLDLRRVLLTDTADSRCQACQLSQRPQCAVGFASLSCHHDLVFH